MRVLVRRMGEPFECGEGLFRREVEHAGMSLDHLEVEGGHVIKEHLIGSKPRGMIGLVVYDLLDRGGGFCHAKFLISRLDVRAYWRLDSHCPL